MDVRRLLLFCFVCLFAALYARPAVPKASGGSVSSHLLAGALGGVAEALCHAHLSVWVNYLGIQAQVLTLQAGTLPTEPSPQLDRLF